MKTTNPFRSCVDRLSFRFALALAALGLMAGAGVETASAQGAGSWVDIGRGVVGSGASASGALQVAHSKSRQKNGLGFGHGFALGAGPGGIALSNSVGAGGGPLGVAHNVQLNIGPGGAHVSHGGVVSQGGNRRVVAGGQTSTVSGRPQGGSYASGYGHRTRAHSQSRTVHWGQPTGQQVGQPAAISTPSGNGFSRFGSGSSSRRSGGIQIGRFGRR